MTVSPRDIVRSGLCIGCGSCAADAPGARMVWDDHGQLKPEGPAGWYAVPDRTFAARCPFSPEAANEDAIAADRFPAAPAHDPRLGHLAGAWVGHAAEDAIRDEGSSGGMVTWVARELLRTGAVDAVAHVAPSSDPAADGRFFGYVVSRDEAALRRGAKSRYYPIELSDVIRTIRAVPGRYAVVGIPCFIKAVNLLRRTDPMISERVTHLLGLFCGHMKSARLVESFAWQTGAAMEEVRAVDYRVKDAGRPANWYRAQLTLADGTRRAEDWWHFADGDWGAGFFQNNACNMCDDVVAETADVSFGDAWVEPYSSDGRGTNVVIARDPVVARMIDEAAAAGRLSLSAVDADFVANTQAAGLRHRREGLAYRLTWDRRRVRLRKRVAPTAGGLPWRRRLVYRLRWWIAGGSNRLFALARTWERPGLYLRPARAVLRLYQGVTWGQGRIGKAADWLERRLR